MFYWRRFVGFFAAVTTSAAAASVEFNRDVRPILSENCFYCHGQDAARREAKLRLDQRENCLLYTSDAADE